MPLDADKVDRQLMEIVARISKIEDKQRDYASDERVRLKEAEHLDERFDRLEKRIDKGASIMSKLVWIFGVAVLSGFVNWMLKGGLVVTPPG